MYLSIPLSCVLFIRGACLLWSPRCAAGTRRYSRGHDRPTAAPGRALAVAAHGGSAGGAGPAGPGVRAAGSPSDYQGDAAEARAHGETPHLGRGVRGRKCRQSRGKTHAGRVSSKGTFTTWPHHCPFTSKLTWCTGGPAPLWHLVQQFSIDCNRLTQWSYGQYLIFILCIDRTALQHM